MLNTIRKHFPESKAKWSTYSKTMIPIILGSLLFALNGFIDNFMVGKYDGITALTAANSWTNIIKGILYGIGGAGSVILAQFFYAKKYDKSKEIVRLRYLLSVSMGVLFAILGYFIPRELNGIFLKGEAGSDVYEKDMKMAVDYMKVIGLQWIIFCITFNLGSQLREVGHAKVVMIWGFGTLGTNIALNSIFMYVLDMGVVGAAWASVAGRVVALVWGIVYIKIKKVEIGFNPLSIFKISWETIRLYFKRWFLIVFISTTVVFITFRNALWSQSFPTGSIATGIGALAILGIASTIYNIFTVVFNSLATMSAAFVGSELGKGNIEQAKINSNELKGFNTTVALGLSGIMLIIALLVPYMNFLVQDDPNIAKDLTEQLRQGQFALFIVCAVYPIWIWFSTSYRNAIAGGKGIAFSFTDWFISGPVQLGILALIGLVIVPNTNMSFITAYGLFYLSDLLKLVIIEYLYYKTEWAHSITKEEAREELAGAHIEIGLTPDKPE